MDETGDALVTEIGRNVAPWGKELVVQALSYESGMRLARVRIREGRRFTVLDLDATTATWLDAALQQALTYPQAQSTVD